MIKCICGDENCNGFCNEAIGSRVFKFLNTVNLVKSHVREASKDGSGKPILVIGGQLNEDGTISKIYKSNYILPSEHKLYGVGGINTRLALRTFISMADIGNETIEVLDDIEKRNLVIVPFRPKSNIKIKVYKTDMVTNKAKLVEVSAKIVTAKWSVEVIDGIAKDIQEILTDYVDIKTKVRGKAYISDYGVRFSMEGYEEKKPKEFSRRQVIKMSSHGYFYTIAFQFESRQYIVDNSNIYYRTATGNTIVVGEWGEDGLEVDADTMKMLNANDFTEKEINSISNYLRTYRNYIAPLGTSELNIINMMGEK